MDGLDLLEARAAGLTVRRGRRPAGYPWAEVRRRRGPASTRPRALLAALAAGNGNTTPAVPRGGPVR